MSHRIPTPRARQVGALQRQFAQAPELSFAPLLDAEVVRQALRDEKVGFRDRLFSPLVTLGVFLSQVLDPDHSCRQAVARLLAYRLAHRQPPCSTNTAAYCRARQRLPESVLARLTRVSGWRPLEEAPVPWLWRGRDVKVVDGTTVSMPDTPAHQKAFPQSRSQKPGLGFPIARLVVLFCLAVATVLDAALGPYQGQQTGETALFRQLHDRLFWGAVLLGDRSCCSFFEMALAWQRGVDVVFRMHQCRRVDVRTGRRLGRGDRVVVWAKPQRPAWMDAETYQQIPDTLVVREVRVRVAQVGFRTESLVVTTTLTDPAEVNAADIAGLYRARWQAELELRSLKETMQMDVLRGQGPAMVRKEVWAHLLVYNLIRTLIAQAACEHKVPPLEVSFKGALQTLNAFAPYLLTADLCALEALCHAVLRALVSHRVGNRPDRYEPRAQKRRPKSYALLNKPRDQARALLANRVCD